MTLNKWVGWGALAVSIVALLVVFLRPQIVQEVTQQLGGSSPDFDARVFAHNGLSVGGTIMATSSTGNVTDTAADFRNAPTVIKWTPNLNTTWTIVASSTFPWVPSIGDTATVYLQNASTTAAATLTLAARNTLVDLQFAEATGGDLVLNGLDWAKLTFIRTASNTVTVIFDEMTEAD